MHYHYKSEAPSTVAIVQDYYRARDQFQQQLDALGQLFGGAVAPMHDVTSHYAGGVKLSAARTLDVHWRRPDEWGFRELRVKPVPPKGITKQERAAIREEHDRLLTLWREHCPPRLDKHDYWARLSINTGNLMLSGGVMFEHQGAAFFILGFNIDQAEHAANVAAGKPTSGWIEGAVEILPREYEEARRAKLGERA